MRPSRLAAFLGLSFLSGMFEIGVVIRGLAHEHSLLFTFCLALAYQLGTLVPYPIGISRPASLVLALGVLATLATLGAGDSLATWWLLPLVTMTSAAINVGRIVLGKAEISTTLKRCTRVAGFLSSPLLIQDFALAISIVAAVAMMSLSVAFHHSIANPGSLSDDVGGLRRRFMTATLFFHQVHYFSYCTVILVMLWTEHNPLLAIAIFVGGWITYIASPHLIGQKFEPQKVALAGHVILPFVLCGLALSEANSPAWYTLWVLTGPFGGTIVSLTRYAKKCHGFDEIALASVENAGHCVGSAIAVCWIAASLPLPSLFLVAAGFASLTAITLVMSLPTYRLTWRTGQ